MTCTTYFQITKSFALVAEKILLVCRFLRSPLALLWLIFPAHLLLLLSSKNSGTQNLGFSTRRSLLLSNVDNSTVKAPCILLHTLP